MRTPRLYLHIGTHKTGTTAIQSYSARNRPQLASQGIYYPSLEPLLGRSSDAHHEFAHVIAERSKKPLTIEQMKAITRAWLLEATKNKLSILLSAEPMYRHTLDENNCGYLGGRRKYFERVSTLLSSFDVVPVVVIRRPDLFVESLYKEGIKKRGLGPTCQPGYRQ